ncbi:thiol-disulfide isomerase/thioredoxin [Rheinheimera pacifica]|uniref:TlpA family protein disulfide reductase n=1 Tax=Rheinheimera pacifica TaxID=173990 RepID=UPI0028622762|nr:redoxin family protein [Rheinheimera pacifica]MDR6982395.1 thiol-disulfide isomerase/thioredoxin [Rheinheimera pacifica]
MPKLVCLLLFSWLGAMQPVNAVSADLKLIELEKFPDASVMSLSALPAEKPLYIKLWATWCKPCIEQMPHFQALYQRYGDKVNFVAVNININEKTEEIAAVVQRFGLTMPVWLDTSGRLATSLGLVGTPYSVLMNSAGQQVYSSHESDKALDGLVQRLAQGQQLPVASSDNISSAEQQRLTAPYLQGEHYLFFTATWCDWYLAESRPAMAKHCKSAQQRLNALASQATDAGWTGIVNHLWTDDSALAEFNAQYNMAVPFNIDTNGVLFQHFNVRNIPLLLKVKDGKVLTEIRDFSDPAAVLQQLKQAK